MLSADIAYAWSWRTATALAAAIALYWFLRLVVKRYRPVLYQSLQTEALMLGRRKNRPWDPSDNHRANYVRAFHWWLFTFGFLQTKDPLLISLSLLDLASMVICWYFVVAEPIYFGSP